MHVTTWDVNKWYLIFMSIVMPQVVSAILTVLLGSSIKQSNIYINGGSLVRAWAEKKRALYTPFAHSQFSHDFWVFGNFHKPALLH